MEDKAKIRNLAKGVITNTVMIQTARRQLQEIRDDEGYWGSLDEQNHRDERNTMKWLCVNLSVPMK